MEEHWMRRSLLSPVVIVLVHGTLAVYCLLPQRWQLPTIWTLFCFVRKSSFSSIFYCILPSECNFHLITHSSFLGHDFQSDQFHNLLFSHEACMGLPLYLPWRITCTPISVCPALWRVRQLLSFQLSWDLYVHAPVPFETSVLRLMPRTRHSDLLLWQDVTDPVCLAY